MNMYEFISYKWWTLAPAMSMGFPFHRVLRLIEALSIAPNKFEALRHGRWAAGRAGKGLAPQGWTSFERCPTRFRTLLPSGYDIHRNSHGKILSFLKNGKRKPSISIRAMASMAMLVITRGYIWDLLWLLEPVAGG